MIKDGRHYIGADNNADEGNNGPTRLLHILCARQTAEGRGIRN